MTRFVHLAPVVSLAVFGCSGPTATQLAITSAPLTFNRGDCSPAVTVQAQDANGKPVKVSSPVAIQLSGDPTVFTFASDSVCGSAVSDVSITQGNDSVTFFMKGVKAGSGTLNVLGDKLTSSTQTVTVTEPPYLIAQVCSDLAAALCDYEVRCGAANSEATCLSLINDKYHTLSGCGSDQQSAINDGRITEDPAAARACVAAIKNSFRCTRDDVLSNVPECVSALVGTVVANGTCYTDDDCGINGFCTATGVSCPGQCQTRLQSGAAASRDRACAQGLYVYQGACASPVALGGSCAPSGGSLSNQRCADGDYCDASHICNPLRTSGQTCAADTDCALLLVCANGTCNSPGAQAATCNIGVLGQPSIPCELDLYCDVNSIGTPGTCKTLEGADGGCYFSFACAANLYCDGAVLVGTPAKGICLPQKPSPDACQSTDECTFPLYCDLTGHCAARKPLDTACTSALLNECSSATSSKECATGLCCTAGQCKNVSCHDPTP